MFQYEELIKQLGNFNDIKKKEKFLKSLLSDKDFIRFLFQPPNIIDINNIIQSMYNNFSRPKVINAMVEMIDDAGYDKFDRNHTVFLYSLCNISIQKNNERILKIAESKKNGSISSKEADRQNENSVKFNDMISTLLKRLKKIVKTDAKELSKESKVPKNICLKAYYTVPDPKYVDKYKIGYYLNILLNNIYSDISVSGDAFEEDNIRWRTFFKEIFGKENVVEAATFILLEGVHRIDKYNNNSAVKKYWDSLTTFALNELNEAPESIRNQMIELYIKRIGKMFANGSFDLRVDMLSISGFPEISKTVSKYKEKISEIIKSSSKQPSLRNEDC